MTCPTVVSQNSVLLLLPLLGGGHCVVFRRPLVALLVRIRPLRYWFEDESRRRLSGFRKIRIGACSETCAQFHEFGVQSIAARRGERVKRKKRHVGPLGQHVVRFPKAKLIGADREYETLVARVVGLIEAPGQGVDLPLDIRGTAFQQRVWRALQDIPAGRTVSYAELAARIGSPKAVRAVAGACAANHIAVAIPCHRVVRNDGSLSGYAWGVERKQALIAREARP